MCTLREPTLTQHLFILSERVGIASRRRGKHDQTEGHCIGRRDSVLVWHKFHDHDSAGAAESAMHLAQQQAALVYGEVVKEIRQEDQIVVRTNVHIEHISGDGVETRAQSGTLGIRACNLENRRPVKGDDLRLRIVPDWALVSTPSPSRKSPS